MNKTKVQVLKLIWLLVFNFHSYKLWNKTFYWCTLQFIFVQGLHVEKWHFPSLNLMHHEIFIIISIILSTEWKSLHSRVIGVNFYTLPNICEISPDGPSPSCHLGDGFTDLVIVKECSRLQMHSHIQRNFNSKDQVSFAVMSEILMFTKPKILTKNLTKNILVNN